MVSGTASVSVPGSTASMEIQWLRQAVQRQGREIEDVLHEVSEYGSGNKAGYWNLDDAQLLSKGCCSA